MLALKTHLTTALQTASTQHLPTCVTDLIADYAAPDYSIALEKYDLDETYQVASTARNKEIGKMVGLAITSPDCDPKIKSHIFFNFTRNPNVRHELKKIVMEIQAQPVQINLNNVNLSGLNLIHLNLSKMTARGASFVRTNLNKVDLSEADLTGATFNRSDMCLTKLTGAILKNTHWIRTYLAETCLQMADLSGATMRSVFFYNSDLFNVNTDDQLLNTAINTNKKYHGLIFPRASAVLRGIHSTRYGFRALSNPELDEAYIAITSNCIDPDYFFYLS